ncbi:hypothetical protein CBS147346_9383 [Aspergillus niger]|nr:hypothetical protein CBS147346_9383 [Aspergillus niger]
MDMETKIAESASPPMTDELSDLPHGYPEGGLEAWLVVLGAWCAMIPSMGLLNCLGILHAWTSKHQLQDYSESSIGWIFGAYSFFLYAAGAQTGPILDTHGPNYVIIPGSIGMVIALIGFSFSQEFYQIFLSFSVLGGLSACTLFIPAISCIGHWFDVRRGYATGIACTAGGLGGVIFPVIILFAAPRIGFPWAIRIIALISAFLLLISCLTLKTRLPNDKNVGASVDFHALREKKYAATTIAVFLVEFAVFIPITYTSSYGIHVGLDNTLAGAAISLTPVCISQVCKTEDLGKRSGTTFTIASVGTLTGIPIAGAIQQQNQGDYWGLIVFGGVLYAASAVAFAVARGIGAGWKLMVKF